MVFIGVPLVFIGVPLVWCFRLDRKLGQAVALTPADAGDSLKGNMSEYIFCLEIMVGKEMKSTLTIKNFLESCILIGMT